MFCEGCFQTQRGMAVQIEQARQKAKEMARENKVAVLIYRDGYDIAYIRADRAPENLQIVDRITPY